MKITRRQLRRIISEAIGESQTAGPPISGMHAISLGGDYGKPPRNPAYDSRESYVLERSGVGWGEKFFVELDGRNNVHWGPLASAYKFRDTPAAEKMQKEIDRLEGFYTRVRPTSFFE